MHDRRPSGHTTAHLLLLMVVGSVFAAAIASGSQGDFSPAAFGWGLAFLLVAPFMIGSWRDPYQGALVAMIVIPIGVFVLGFLVSCPLSLWPGLFVASLVGSALIVVGAWLIRRNSDSSA